METSSDARYRAVFSRLRDVLPIVEATKINFRQELGVFLPADAQSLVKDFKNSVLAELNRSIGLR